MPALLAAFQAGTGSVAADELLLAIASSLSVLLLTWTAWVAYAQLRAWRSGRADLFMLLWTVLRSIIVLLVMGFIVH